MPNKCKQKYEYIENTHRPLMHKMCNFCLTNEAIDNEPGTPMVDRHGGSWIRMVDDIDMHLEGYYCNIFTGEYLHASKLIY